MIDLIAYTPNKKKGFDRRVLARAEDMREATELAHLFLSDSRDNVESVHFYDCRRRQFRGWLGGPNDTTGR